MKGILIFLAGLVVGGGLSFFVATGVGAGVGIATGLMAGTCVTVEAAKGLGFITAEQVDEVLQAAAAQFGQQDLADANRLSGGDAECQKIVDELKAAAATEG